MNITEHEMRGLLAGKCLPADILVGESLAAYLVRKFGALQQKLDAAEKKVEKFAVQCAAAKIAAAYAKEGRHDYSLNTPDIDTYLNSVRADAIVEAASRIAAQVWEEDEGAGMVAAVNALAIIEKEIRAGEAK
ncbi:hypothetical protein [Pantoea sp.]|uniref:hypothetical protein n=1 Tax=Pantoea sp. TaxID=69393 RepID=UPI0028ADD775|nr:hypothetical protein [Pantoea sp.]